MHLCKDRREMPSQAIARDVQTRSAWQIVIASRRIDCGFEELVILLERIDLSEGESLLPDPVEIGTDAVSLAVTTVSRRSKLSRANGQRVTAVASIFYQRCR